MTPEPQKNKWAKIENVFELLETKDRKLTDGEKQIIAGQRKINPYRDAGAVEAVNPHLHNVPMQIAAERGLPALAVWLGFIAVLARVNLPAVQGRHGRRPGLARHRARRYRRDAGGRTL